jgi:hypothetical protein
MSFFAKTDALRHHIAEEEILSLPVDKYQCREKLHMETAYHFDALCFV